MTTPTGSPAWRRTTDFTDYGGHADKQNFQGQTVVNPRTDVGAEGFSRLASDMAAVVRTAEFAVMQVHCDDAPPGGPPTVESCRAMTGVTVTSYLGSAPPGGFPKVTRLDVGAVEVTFPAGPTDEYGVAGSLAIDCPVASLIGAGVAVSEVVSATVVRVRCFDFNNSPIADARFSLTVGSGS